MLDHGVLNVPLSKRGNIDSQLDKYKAEQASIKKDAIAVKNAEFRDDKEIAKDLWSKVDFDLVKTDAKKRGIKYSEFKAILHDFVKWQPKKAIIVLPNYIK